MRKISDLIPLFRSTRGRSQKLNDRPLLAANAYDMVQRRLKDAGLPTHLCPHSFRVLTATDLFKHGAAVEEVQYLLGHASPSTTQIYNRTNREVSRNLVERISV